jgi:hypothetical protein
MPAVRRRGLSLGKLPQLALELGGAQRLRDGNGLRPLLDRIAETTLRA